MSRGHNVGGEKLTTEPLSHEGAARSSKEQVALNITNLDRLGVRRLDAAILCRGGFIPPFNVGQNDGYGDVKSPLHRDSRFLRFTDDDSLRFHICRD